MILALALATWAALIPRLELSIVRLQFRPLQTYEMRCTAVVVAPQRVITDTHCLSDGEQPYIDMLPAAEVARAGKLVLLETKGRQSAWRPLRIRRSPIQLGEPILALGYGFAEQLMVMAGVMSQNAADELRFATHAIVGMSGGPIVDAHGELITLVEGSQQDLPASADSVVTGARQSDVWKLVPR